MYSTIVKLAAEVYDSDEFEVAFRQEIEINPISGTNIVDFKSQFERFLFESW